VHRQEKCYHGSRGEVWRRSSSSGGWCGYLGGAGYESRWGRRWAVVGEGIGEGIVVVNGRASAEDTWDGFPRRSGR
jgi:hypothetical protein